MVHYSIGSRCQLDLSEGTDLVILSSYIKIFVDGIRRLTVKIKYPVNSEKYTNVRFGQRNARCVILNEISQEKSRLTTIDLCRGISEVQSETLE